MLYASACGHGERGGTLLPGMRVAVLPCGVVLHACCCWVRHAGSMLLQRWLRIPSGWQMCGKWMAGEALIGDASHSGSQGVVAGRPPGAAASAAALPQSARGLSSSALPDADVCDMKERLALVLRCDVRKTHLGALAAACASQCGPCAVHVDSDSLGRACLGRGLGVSLHPTPRGRGSSGARRPRVH